MHHFQLFVRPRFVDGLEWTFVVKSLNDSLRMLLQSLDSLMIGFSKKCVYYIEARGFAVHDLKSLWT